MTTRPATSKEQRLIQRVLDETARIRRAAEKREKLFEQLSALLGEDIVIADVGIEVVNADGQKMLSTRAFAVGRPKGRYVFFPVLDFTTNRAITGADKKALRSGTALFKTRSK